MKKFSAMLKEEVRTDRADADLRASYPKISDRDVARSATSGEFNGFRDRLSRPRMARIVQSRRMNAAVALGPGLVSFAATAGAFLMGMSEVVDRIGPLSFVLVVLSGFIGAGWHLVVVDRRRMRFSPVGASLYRKFLRSAALVEEMSSDKAIVEEMRRLLEVFQDLAARELELSTALDKVLSDAGLEWRPSAGGRVGVSAHLAGAAAKSFSLMEANRVEVEDEMVRVLDQVTGLGETLRHAAHLAAQDDVLSGEGPVPLLPLEGVEETDMLRVAAYQQAYSQVAAGHAQLRQLREDAVPVKARLRA